MVPKEKTRPRACPTLRAALESARTYTFGTATPYPVREARPFPGHCSLGSPHPHSRCEPDIGPGALLGQRGGSPAGPAPARGSQAAPARPACGRRTPTLCALGTAPQRGCKCGPAAGRAGAGSAATPSSPFADPLRGTRGRCGSLLPFRRRLLVRSQAQSFSQCLGSPQLCGLRTSVRNTPRENF